MSDIVKEWEALCRNKTELWSMSLGDAHNYIDAACEDITRLKSRLELADRLADAAEYNLNAEPGCEDYDGMSEALKAYRADGGDDESRD